jgi:two-component system sensor histidine kinase KdpD
MRERDALDVRPTAEEMLARIAATEPGGRGRLRVYLGMAPGVGKTYRMLEEGHRRVTRGTDAVIGFVEPHGRPKTQALMEGLEVVPRRRIEYHGVIVEEMDTDAVIRRHPVVALVDELAHTNVPGSPYEKRWEDVELIREAGIHVVTTLNVQHLESVADAVETITGAPVRERLPDDVLAAADEIELVDMSPHALRQRMRHGNVYPPDRTRVALDRFFTEPNLTALRDLALRFTARRVEGQLEAFVTDGRLAAMPQTSERVVVVVDGSPAGATAVRRAAALAGLLRADLVAVVPEPSPTATGDEGRNLREVAADAADFGADVIRVEADDLASAVARLAEARGATHVVIAHRPQGRLDRLRHRPLAEALLDRLPGVEVHVVGAGHRADRPDRNHG